MFTTYQSGPALARAARAASLRFDLGIFDEAHKTVGAKGKVRCTPGLPAYRPCHQEQPHSPPRAAMRVAEFIGDLHFTSRDH